MHWVCPGMPTVSGVGGGHLLLASLLVSPCLLHSDTGKRAGAICWACWKCWNVWNVGNAHQQSLSGALARGKAQQGEEGGAQAWHACQLGSLESGLKQQRQRRQSWRGEAGGPGEPTMLCMVRPATRALWTGVGCD